MTTQVATFRIDDLVLGIDIMFVREIFRNITLTTIPDSPPVLRGLMKLRGKVVTIIDLKVCLGG